jgi:proline iminopeptidase
MKWMIKSLLSPHVVIDLKIAHIPTFMVNGRYDVICPSRNAYRLHELLPKSELVIAEAAGHLLGERAIKRALRKAMKSFE